jgi:hypothetical protein
MLHGLVAMRGLIAMGLAAAVGAWGLHTHPVDMTDPFLGLIEARSPRVFVALVYGYAALWFSTPFFGASLVLSLFAITALVATRAFAPDLCRPIHSQRIGRRRRSCWVKRISRRLRVVRPVLYG